MPSSNAWLDYPVFEHAWSKQELATEQDTANLRANDSAMTMESEKYFNCPLSRQRDTPPESPKYIEMQSSPMSSPISVYSSTPMVHQQSLDSELRILNAELAKCQMTRDALARREAALLEMKAEVEEEMKLKADTEAEERQRQEEEEEESDVDEVLFMRNVQKRVEDGLKNYGTRTSDTMRGRHDTRDQDQEKEKATKPVPISAPERRRLARLALLKRDPRLAN
ncbi:hypothetical protein L13192_06565 [Pyrenophora tritici-repentis]|uniref:Uncharacterized protein n=2 Tax=Pyrenophora tritici-repentis TaxID=45151 RepID=A0A922STW6_9PLEO|nr:uncharacterized protein PTRG_09512 [Pyrenophora tritici-repentis Pt-1C-BFP]EDU42563.1 hypothetical protein PTRG_09512 [Pyrenophora tritici-repentis Pt-1C-BFP]KAI1512084.1 hypothetical protein Ptr86124_008924 [Pyrenophora tritici-repentis]KAI1669106.1 hypothetical protein L13192_06565 [Pyrenophora tritici-repentis]KAI1684042.1 hypothetical protein KJE20_06547 [Pyrenophora tritici-repentis]